MRIARIIKSTCAVLAVAAATLLSTATAMADKIHLNDGRVLEGTVEREGDGFVYFRVVIGGIENVQFFTTDQFKKLEKASDATEEAPVEDAKRAATAKADSSARSGGKGKATRVAILNFGAPGYWNGEIDDTVGIQISAQAWEDAIPLLEKDDVDVVVVRINSGGGLLLEMVKFFDVFQEEYKPRFRTVAWVESAISAAAMSPWSVEEFYMLPQGSIGACTGWSGALEAVDGWELEDVLYLMEQMSAAAGRNPAIMRSMQIMEPLSCDIDETTGEVTWYQTEDGDHLVNPAGRILTFNATDAVKFKFAKGIASTKEELVRAMGLQEVEWVGQRAADYIDENMRASDRTQKRLALVYTQYADTVAAAAAAQDEQTRGAFVAKARRYLNQLRSWVSVNPNFQYFYPLDDEWFQQQEQMLRDLMK